MRRPAVPGGPVPADDADRLLDLGFTSLISSLDNTASEIVAYQRDSTVQRKDLAQKTKDFRKLDDAAKLNEMKALLKGTPSGPRHALSLERL